MLIIRTWKAKLIVALPFAGLFFLFLAFLGLRVSESPKFCNTCHYMKPYYNAWKTSTHNDVSCLKCHYEPGLKSHVKGKIDGVIQLAKYVTHTYNPKPKAEIPDAACLRGGCHEERLLTGPVLYKENISFDHKYHLGEILRVAKLRCTTCHSQIVQGEHMTVTESVCFTCHFKGVNLGTQTSKCTLCHGAPKKEVVHEGIRFNHQEYLENKVDCLTCHIDVTQGEGKVSRERCHSCHAEPEDIKKYNDTKFIHENHVTKRKVECFECHEKIKHGMKHMAGTITLNCSQCHRQQHTISEEMYMGMGVKGVSSQPSVMFKTKVDCNGCHLYPREEKIGVYTESVQLAKPEACDACHGKGFGQMTVPAWQSFTRDSYKEVEETLEEVKAKIESGQSSELSKTELDKAGKLYQSARDKLDFVKADGSWGVHNLGYAETVLDKAKEDLEKILRLLEKGDQK